MYICELGAYFHYSIIGSYQYMMKLLVLDRCRADRPGLLTDTKVGTSTLVVDQ